MKEQEQIYDPEINLIVGAYNNPYALVERLKDIKKMKEFDVEALKRIIAQYDLESDPNRELLLKFGAIFYKAWNYNFNLWWNNLDEKIQKQLKKDEQIKEWIGRTNKSFDSFNKDEQYPFMLDAEKIMAMIREFVNCEVEKKLAERIAKAEKPQELQSAVQI